MLTTLQLALVLQYILDNTTAFGTNSTGPSSLDFSYPTLDITPGQGWDQLFTGTFNIPPAVSVTGNTHTSTTIDGISSMTNLAIGQTITGSGVPTGTTIIGVNVSGSSITLSLPTTSTLTGTALVAQLAPVGLAVGAAVAGGSLTAGTYYYRVSATFNANGTPIETIASNEASGTTAGGNLTLPLTWTAVTGASGYKIYRGTSAGSENKLLATLTSGTTTTYSDTGAAGTGASLPSTPNNYAEFSVQSFTNLVNVAVTAQRFLNIFMLPSGSTAKIAPGGTNGLQSFFEGSQGVLPTNGGCFFFSDVNTGNGWVIDSTHNTLRITNTGPALLTANVAMLTSTAA